jgi:cytidylate kinase
VRRVIVARQQAIIRTGDWVADGRDIGTAVAPHAEVKIFLTADPEVRARRRYDELVAGGADVELGDVLQQIAERDGLDTSRAESPLVVADGAHIVDTTDRPIDEVVDTIVELVSSAQAGAR